MNEQELLDALVRADKAGDTKAAQIFADQINQLRAGGQSSGMVPGPGTQADQVRAEYDAMPWWKQGLTAADDTIRLGTDGATFGYADKASAGMNSVFGGKPYEEGLADERKYTENARARAGSAGVAAEIGGGVMGATALGGPGLLSRVPATASFLPRLAGATAAGTVEGAAYGGLGALGHDSDLAEGLKSGAAFGAIGGAGGEVVSQLFNRVMRNVRGQNPNVTPSLDELESTKNALYNDVKDRGAVYPPNRVVRTVSDLNADMRGDIHAGVRPIRHANADDMLKQLTDIGSNTRGESLYNLDTTRQAVFGDVVSKGGPEGHFGRKMVKGIDDLIADPTGVTTAIGTPDEAIETLMKARNASSRLKNASQIRSAMGEASDNAAAAGTGSDVGNQLRQKVKSIKNTDTADIFYNPEEMGLMQRIVQGSTGGNIARSAARAAKGYTGKGIGASAGAFLASTLGGPVAGGIGAVGGLAGMHVLGDVAEKAASRSTKKMTDELLHLVSTGRKFDFSRPAGPISEMAQESLVRAAIMSAENERNRKARRKEKE